MQFIYQQHAIAFVECIFTKIPHLLYFISNDVDYFRGRKICRSFCPLNIGPNIHRTDPLYSWSHAVYSQYSFANVASSTGLRYAVALEFWHLDIRPHNKSCCQSVSWIRISEKWSLKPCVVKYEIFYIFFKIYHPSYQTNSGSMNWMTMTKPSVTRMSPRFSRSIRQQTPLTFGQNGFGADISSTWAPARRERLLRPVFAELATE